MFKEPGSAGSFVDSNILFYTASVLNNFRYKNKYVGMYQIKQLGKSPNIM
jgi:hypothetical protein